LLVPLLSFSLTTAVAKTAAANPALEPCSAIQDPIQRFYCEGAILSGRASQALMNGYTPRQQQLAQVIGKVVYAYYEQTGQPLPVNQETLRIVMQGIGASASEASFIYDRMVAHSNAIAGITEADVTINRMNSFLNCLQTQGTGCIP